MTEFEIFHVTFEVKRERGSTRSPEWLATQAAASLVAINRVLPPPATPSAIVEHDTNRAKALVAQYGEICKAELIQVRNRRAIDLFGEIERLMARMKLVAEVEDTSEAQGILLTLNDRILREVFGLDPKTFKRKGSDA